MTAIDGCDGARRTRSAASTPRTLVRFAGTLPRFALSFSPPMANLAAGRPGPRFSLTILAFRRGSVLGNRSAGMFSCSSAGAGLWGSIS